MDMKFLKQFALILAVSFAGELLNNFLPFPVPAGIYGVGILFLCLEFKLLKLSAVKDTADFLIEIMPVMFIPPAVGLIEVWGSLETKWHLYFAAAVVSTFFVMFVSGRTAQYFADKIAKRGEDNEV